MSRRKSNLAPVTPLYAPEAEPALIKLDLGCGKNCQSGFAGVDVLDFGQKHVLDLRQTPWPWADSSVGEVRSSHFLEHLTNTERVVFFNELYRVLKPDATAQIVTPNWSHACAYGDPTHQWPPMSAWYPLYLHKDWREANAPHCGYTCHFDHVAAGSWDQNIAMRNSEFKEMAMNQYTNCFRDLIVTLTARK